MTFTVTTGPDGPDVLLDGAPVQCEAVFVSQVPGQPAQVTVHAPAGVTGDGLVTVVRDPTPGEVLAAVADWLASIDPAQLVPVVESRFVSFADNPVSLTVQVLTELAREAADG